MIGSAAWLLAEITLVLGVAKVATPRLRSATGRHRLYAAALLLCLLLPAAGWTVPSWSPAPIGQFFHQTELAPDAAMDGSRGAVPTASSPRDAASPAASRAGLIGTGWILGTLLSLLVLARATRRRGGIARRARLVENGPLRCALDAAAGTVSVTSSVRLLVSSEVEVPAVWGLFRGTILLPTEAQAWPRARLDAVFLHELAHLRRRDGCTRLAARVVTAIYWFHPLVRSVASALHEEAELACDRIVVKNGHDRLDYAEILIGFVEETPAPLAAGLSSPPLTRRIDALLAGFAPAGTGLLVRALAVCALIGVGVAAALIGPPVAAAARLDAAEAVLTEHACIDRSAMRVSLASTGAYEIGAGDRPFDVPTGHRLVVRAWIRLPGEPGCPTDDPGQLRVEAHSSPDSSTMLAAWYEGRRLPPDSPVPALLARAMIADQNRRLVDHPIQSSNLPSFSR